MRPEGVLWPSCTHTHAHVHRHTYACTERANTPQTMTALSESSVSVNWPAQTEQKTEADSAAIETQVLLLA